MKKILFFLLTVIAIQGCSSEAAEINAGDMQNNYVILLDLSDRIIQKQDQITIDTSAIRVVLDEFQRKVRENHLVVKSKDRFSIRIIPQKGSNLRPDLYENTMSIDMGKFTAADKLTKLNDFIKNFSVRLEALYTQAKLGPNKRDYAGVDIWQYFNEQINSDLDRSFKNRVLILTDGYFDFEDKNHGITEQNYATTSSPLLNLMTGLNWKEKADSLHLGVLPVNLAIEAEWTICGIQSKLKSGKEELLEVQKLCYLWTNWLKNSGAKNVREPILSSSASKVKNLVQKSMI